MASLTQEQKEFIVQRYAMFDRPKDIREAFKEQYGIEISRQQIDTYNPRGAKAAKGSIAKGLMAAFEAQRAAFVGTVDNIPISQRSYRLRKLQQMFEAAFDKGNLSMAANLLTQAREEMEEKFTGKMEVTHKGKVAVVDELTPADKRSAIVDRMAAVMAEQKRDAPRESTTH